MFSVWPLSIIFPYNQKPDDDRVVNFNFNRKKNTQEKEQWRQLIQSIFDSSPRDTPQFNGARVSSKSKFANVPFNYGSGKPSKSRSQTVNDLDGGKEDKALDEEEDDVLKDEREENVDLSDKISEEEEENEKETGASPALPPDEESEEDDGRESSTGNRKRQATADNSEISQEDEDEEPEDGEEEGNQYLQAGKNASNIANIGNGSAKRSTLGSANGSSFGSRINRSNATSAHSLQSPGRRVQTEKPKFTMHFQLGKSAGAVVSTTSTTSSSSATSTTESAAISDQLITDLVNDPSFSGDKSTTSYAAVAALSGAATTTTASPLEFTPSTERFDVLDTSTEDDDLFERSQVSFNCLLINYLL